jgi:hypothetical protein
LARRVRVSTYVRGGEQNEDVEPLLFLLAASAASLPVVRVLKSLFPSGKGVEDPEHAGSADLEERIAVLTESLRSATTTIGEIEAEVGERQRLVERLRGDAERYEHLVALNQPEVDAVSQALRGELREELNQERKRSLRQDILLGLVWFVGGIGATVVVQILTT